MIDWDSVRAWAPVATALFAFLTLLWTITLGRQTVGDFLRKLRERLASRPPQLPRFVPPLPDPAFVGRQDDLRQVVDSLRARRSLALWGDPGVGKTALARQAVNHRRVQAAFPGRVLWRDSTPASYEGVIDDVARALDVKAVLEEGKSGDLKADALRSFLSQQKPLLVVFDSADGPAAAALDGFANAGFPLTLLATSRDVLRHLTQQRVDVLSDEEALQLFPVYAPDEALLPDGALARWARRLLRLSSSPRLLPAVEGPVRRMLPLLGGNAQALELAAGALTTRSAAALLADLQARPLETLEPLRRAFEVSWGYLQHEERRLFAALGLFAGDSFSREATLALAGEGARPHLDRLVQVRLARFDQKAGRYSLHPLLREYARGKEGEIAVERDALLLRLAAYYADFVSAHVGTALEELATLDREWGNLLSPSDGRGLLSWLQRRPEEDGEAATLLVALLANLAAYMDLRGYWGEGAGLVEAALPRADAVEDEALRASFFHNSAVLLHNRGEVQRAQELYQRSLEIFERLGDQQSMAATLHQQGILAQGQGRLEEARELYRRSLEIAERLGDQQGIAKSLHQQGRLAQDQGRVEEARGLYQRSLEIKELLGDQRGMAHTHHQLGILAQEQGRMEEARGLYQRSLEIKELLGDQQGMAMTYGQMGRLAEEGGDMAAAQGHYRRALELFTALDSPTREMAARALQRVREALALRGGREESP